MAFLLTNINEKPHSDQGVNSSYDLVFRSVRGLYLPRGMQISYSATVDLVAELAVSQVCSFVYDVISFSITAMRGHINTLSFRIDDGSNDRGLRLFESSKEDFENQMGAYFEMFNGFEQVFKNLFVEHIYYNIPFKGWFLKNNISLILFWKNSCALTLKHEFEATLFNHLFVEEFFHKWFSKRSVDHLGV
ncbi:hypothetical protein M9H77_23433 [Catharanthus roseus]|uniref:Uncharacterized protein n=1 Tax=Catharanthus roseus TaxID=4058 RepID=A0ACC0AUT9_CATRO|nr:hypothetical protein M9H77_23433 [Catharanthus roseus]